MPTAEILGYGQDGQNPGAGVDHDLMQWLQGVQELLPRDSGACLNRAGDDDGKSLRPCQAPGWGRARETMQW